ncbi:MAG: hypothetical protein JKY01_07975 [Pseudomonadales bacterium]|nr:hypothetical protein [Pseudomonadales bacterium]
MPWWAITYLTIFILLTIGGIFDDMNKPKRVSYISGEIIGAIFVTIFMLGYFNENIGNSLGLLVFPMLIIGVAHELFSAKRTMDEEARNNEYTKKELFYLNNLGLLFTNIFIVPGYVFGLMVGLRNVGL